MLNTSTIIGQAALDAGINIDAATDAQIMYLFQISLNGIEFMLRNNLAYFPETSLNEVNDALNVMFFGYLDLTKRSIDIQLSTIIARVLPVLQVATAHIAAASRINQETSTDMQARYTSLPLYNNNVLECYRQIVTINKILEGS